MSTSEISPTSDLSEREREILRLVATAASNKEIAQRLHISPNTVKVHLRNIFAKIEVASRTEATLYAIQHGFVQVATSGAPDSATLTAEMAESASVAALPDRAHLYRRYAAGASALLVLLLVLGWALTRSSAGPLAPIPLPTPDQWEARAAMPTARRGFAATVFDNQIYAIGGETAAGVTGTVERYDPGSDAWTGLRPMPTPVADVNSVSIGGLIYVPGGRRADGSVTRTLAVYDPRRDTWMARAPMPETLSAYALAAFEGKLFVFGGWDGHVYVASVYIYDPEQDAWSTGTPMSQARGLAGAVVSGGKIYVVGGTDGTHALTLNEEYSAAADAQGGQAWRARASLPAGRYSHGIASVAEIIQILGGRGEGERPPLAYFPQQDAWQAFESFDAQGDDWSDLRLVALETNLYALGGERAERPTADTWSHQAIYIVLFPLIQR